MNQVSGAELRTNDVHLYQTIGWEWIILRGGGLVKGFPMNITHLNLSPHSLM